MNGGTLCVPSTETNEFMNVYVNEVSLPNNKLYVVELKTPIFKFFMDIDYVAHSKLSPDDIIKIVKDIHQVIPGKCIVATAPPKPKDDLIKTGIHIIWPELTVNKQKAIQLMNDVKNTLSENISKHIDDSVYKGSGLRMIWSYKKGKYGDEDPYVPFYNAYTDKLISNTHPNVTALTMFSIRIGDSTITTCNTGYESTDIELFLYTCMNNELRYKGFIGTKPDTFIITRIIKDPSSDGIFYIQTQSRFCMHKMSVHKSNHVYFVIDTTRRVLFQKCFDDDCKKYRGLLHKVPNELLKDL
jgi:hypothetical protein